MSENQIVATAPLADGELAALEALLQQATPGPWVVWEGHPDVYAGLVRKAGTRRAALAEALGIRQDTLKELLAGRASLSLELCGKLEKLCCGTAEVWARRQVDYNNYRQSLPVAA